MGLNITKLDDRLQVVSRTREDAVAMTVFCALGIAFSIVGFPYLLLLVLPIGVWAVYSYFALETCTISWSCVSFTRQIFKWRFEKVFPASELSEIYLASTPNKGGVVNFLMFSHKNGNRRFGRGTSNEDLLSLLNQMKRDFPELKYRPE